MTTKCGDEGSLKPALDQAEISQERQRSFQIIEIAEIDIGRLQLCERRQIGDRRNTVGERILRSFCGEEGLCFDAEQVIERGGRGYLLIAGRNDACPGDVDQRAKIAVREGVVL